MQICLATNIKIENWPIYDQALHFYGMIILVKKGLLQRNSMAAIPKIMSFLTFH